MANKFSTDGKFKNKTSFTPVPTCVIKDKELSNAAKGLYAVIQSYITIPDFVLYKSMIISKSKDKECSFTRAWKELKDMGYLKQYRIRDKESNCFKYEYELLDEPDKSTPCLINVRIDGTDALTNQVISEYVPIEDMVSDIEKNEPEEYNNNSYDIFEEIVKENIGYEFLSEEYPTDMDIIDSMVSIIVDTVTSNAPSVRINKENMPKQQVRSRLLSLNEGHIQYVLECFEKNAHKSISNVRSYLLTSLYNSSATIDAYYQQKYKRDFDIQFNQIE